MSLLQNKQILLGISGGIAAYKSAYLARRLMEAGAIVKVVMSEGAQAFIRPMTFQALTGQPVSTDLLDPAAEAAMGHIELARWADAVVIAPASANVLARLSHGMADDLLSTICLATEAPLFLAPAMNRMMWLNPATVANCERLAERGVGLIGPADGVQACGETGAGRMLEPEQIAVELENRLGVSSGLHTGEPPMLQGRRVLITAGPTREAIDPVRFISNRSSGKMGFAVAEASRRLGAAVTLVAGPVNLNCHSSIQRIDVTTGVEMHDAVMEHVSDCDVFVAVAAVSDYRMQNVQAQKIKKSDDTLNLSLVKNPDILKAVAALPNKPFCVGFAAETEHMEEHARGKMQHKKLDMIAANHVAQPDNPVFGSDTNALEVFIRGDADQVSIAAAEKPQVAQELMQLVAQQLSH